MNLDLEMIVKKMKRIRKINIIKRIEIVNSKQSNFDLFQKILIRLVHKKKSL